MHSFAVERTLCCGAVLSSRFGWSLVRRPAGSVRGGFWSAHGKQEGRGSRGTKPLGQWSPKRLHGAPSALGLQFGPWTQLDGAGGRRPYGTQGLAGPLEPPPPPPRHAASPSPCKPPGGPGAWEWLMMMRVLSPALLVSVKRRYGRSAETHGTAPRGPRGPKGGGGSHQGAPVAWGGCWWAPWATESRASGHGEGAASRAAEALVLVLFRWSTSRRLTVDG